MFHVHSELHSTYMKQLPDSMSCSSQSNCALYKLEIHQSRVQLIMLFYVGVCCCMYTDQMKCPGVDNASNFQLHTYSRKEPCMHYTRPLAETSKQESITMCHEMKNDRQDCGMVFCCRVALLLRMYTYMFCLRHTLCPIQPQPNTVHWATILVRYSRVCLISGG